MDVYVKLGLLIAAAIVLLYMLYDGWNKNRDARTAEMSGLNDKIDEPEFTMSIEDSNAFDQDNVRPARVIGFYADTNIDEPASVSTVNPAHKNIVYSSDPGATNDAQRAPSISSGGTRANVAAQRIVPAKRNTQASQENLLVLSVMAKTGNRFVSYELLQALSNSGMQFGEMNIFHYYQPTAMGKLTLFSLASANKPGDFDLNNMGDFSCTGLMLFLNIGQVSDPQYAFKLMLDIANQLTDDLDGVLCADPQTPWNEKLAWQYAQKITQSKIAMSHDNRVNN
ncbi:MAG: cell division protein ZipA C-terminal FtsZ-binding domain-containing protein [Gammaproteobacteria bacterium]